MDDGLKKYFQEKAQTRFPGEKIVPLGDDPFQEHLIWEENGIQKIHLMFYYNIGEFTYAESVQVVKNLSKRFVWDNEFYRRKMKVYLENDPRNWPEFPLLKVFNIYSGDSAVIFANFQKNSVIKVHVDGFEKTFIFSDAEETIAYGWRTEDCRNCNGQ